MGLHHTAETWIGRGMPSSTNRLWHVQYHSRAFPAKHGYIRALPGRPEKLRLQIGYQFSTVQKKLWKCIITKLRKIHWQIKKIFFSRTAGQISTKLGVNHLWVKGIQVCSNKGLCPIPRGDNSEIAKIHWL